MRPLCFGTMHLTLQNVPNFTRFYILVWFPEDSGGPLQYVGVDRYHVCVCVCVYMQEFSYKITFELN